MQVGVICRHGGPLVSATSMLVNVACLLCEHDVEAVVVIASSAHRPTVIGILTDRDITRALAERGGDLSFLRVIDILAKDTVVLNQDDEIDAAIIKLNSRRVRHAPVIGAGGTLHGLVSRAELLSYQKVA